MNVEHKPGTIIRMPSGNACPYVLILNNNTGWYVRGTNAADSMPSPDWTDGWEGSEHDQRQIEAGTVAGKIPWPPLSAEAMAADIRLALAEPEVVSLAALNDHIKALEAGVAALEGERRTPQATPTAPTQAAATPQAPGQTDNYPVGTIILDAEGEAWVRQPNGWDFAVGTSGYALSVAEDAEYPLPSSFDRVIRTGDGTVPDQLQYKNVAEIVRAYRDSLGAE